MIKVVSVQKSVYPSVLLTYDKSLKYLAERKIIEYKCVSRLVIDTSILNWGDWFFFCRSGYTSDSYLMGKLRKAGKCVVFVLDDDLLNIPDGVNVPAVMKSSEYVRGLRKGIECSQFFASPSKILIEKYGKDKQPILLEEPIIKRREFLEHDGYPVKIGFAGTFSRTDDVNRILSEALLKIKAKYKDKVSIEFMGVKPDFIDKVEGGHIPFVEDYEKYTDTLHSLNWDIGLAPLSDTQFHNCKHYIKFIEYSGMGIVSVMSNVIPYTRLRDDNMPTILCDNTCDGWFNAISTLVDDYGNLQKKRYEVYSIGNEAYSLERCAGNLLTQLSEYEKNRKQKRDRVRFSRAGYIVSQFFSYLKINGVVNTIRKVQKVLAD